MIRPDSSLPPEIELREAEPADDEALYRLFASSRDDLLAAASGWDEKQREQFFRLQFQARQDQYRHRFPAATPKLVVARGEIAGQILVDVGDDELCLVDVSLLPEYRNRGVGSALLRDLIGRAAAENRRVYLHVLADNPAIRLYQRLGFQQTGSDGVHWRMEWSPQAAGSGVNPESPPAPVS